MQHKADRTYPGMIGKAAFYHQPAHEPLRAAQREYAAQAPAEPFRNPGQKIEQRQQKYETDKTPKQAMDIFQPEYVLK